MNNHNALTNLCIKYSDIVNILLFGCFALMFLQFTVDDAFITFRYGYNLAENGIWNWNADHDYVEGYTNFSYAILSVIPHYLGISTFLFFKVIGYILLGLFIYRARQLAGDPLSRFLVTFFLVVNPFIYVHFLSGLETPLFMLLILEIFIQIGRIVKGQKISPYFYIIAFLLPLTRPEGVVFTAFAMLVLLHKQHWKLPKDISFWIMLIAGFSYFAWRYHYFGYVLPNTVYEKSHQHFGAIGYVFNVLEARYYIVALIIAVFAIRHRTFTIAAVSVAAVHVIAYIFTQLSMNYAFRFFMQIYIPLFVFAIHFIGGAEQKINISSYFNTKVTTYLTVLLLIVLPNFNYQDLFNLVTGGARLHEAYKKVGQTLYKYKDKHYTLMMGDAGVLPYYADWKAYDAIGLVDKEIAHYNNSLAYMEKISPDVIFIHSIGTDLEALRLNYHDFDKVYAYIQQHGGYEFLPAVKLTTSYYMAVFVKKEIADFEAIKADLAADSQYSRFINASENKNILFKKMLDLHYLDFPNPGR